MGLTIRDRWVWKRRGIFALFLLFGSLFCWEEADAQLCLGLSIVADAPIAFIRRTTYKAWLHRGEGKHPEVLVSYQDPERVLLTPNGKTMVLPINNPLIYERLLVVYDYLFKNRQYCKVSVYHDETRFEFRSSESSSPVEKKTNTLLEIAFSDPRHLSEHPDMAFAGIVSQLFFEALAKKWEGRWDDFLETEARRAQEKFSDRYSMAELKRYVHEILKLRTTWLTKVDFYEESLPLKPEIRMPFMDQLLSEAAAHHGSISALPTMRDHFKQFYGYPSELVDFWWDTALPDGYEFAIASPTVLRVELGLSPSSDPR